jgi:hypothetical protein
MIEYENLGKLNKPFFEEYEKEFKKDGVRLKMEEPGD